MSLLSIVGPSHGGPLAFSQSPLECHLGLGLRPWPSLALGPGANLAPPLDLLFSSESMLLPRRALEAS